MQLGNILNLDPGVPVVSSPVEFSFLKYSTEGPKRVRIKAQLLPVSEADRQKSKAEALKFLFTDPNSSYREIPEDPKEKQKDRSKPLAPPKDAIVSEELYKLIAYALYDEEDPTKRLVAPHEYPLFRAGLVMAQVEWLVKEYHQLIDDEYPETLPPEEHQALVNEAAKK